MNIFMKRTFFTLSVASLLVVSATAFAFTEPSQAPPGGNVSAPLKGPSLSNYLIPFYNSSIGALANSSISSDGSSATSNGNLFVTGTLYDNSNTSYYLKPSGTSVVSLLKILGGTPGAGKVLTSDAVGLASWATPNAGTVTGVTASAPLSSSGGATPNITLSGTVAPANLGSGTANSTTFLRGDGTWATPSNSGGTVTSITAGNGLSGGTITTSGTISLPTKLDSASASGNGGYISSGDYGGTGSAAYFPSGLWANGPTTWLYGYLVADTIYDHQDQSYLLNPNGNSVLNTIKITGGSPGAGKFLMSDASGNATWGTPANSGGTVTSVTASSPLASSGGATPNITINSSTGSGSVVLSSAPTLSGNVTWSGKFVVPTSGVWGGAVFEPHNTSWGGENGNYATIAAGHGYYYGGLQSGGGSGNEAASGELYVAGKSMLLGDVGIGTATPGQRLVVVGGEANFSNSTYTDPAPGVVYDAKFGGANNGIAVRGSSAFSNDLTVSGNSTLQNIYTDTINSISAGDALEINYRSTSPTKICATQSCGTVSAYFDTNGRVGIGANPSSVSKLNIDAGSDSYGLTVNGTGSFTRTTNGYTLMASNSYSTDGFNYGWAIYGAMSGNGGYAVYGDATGSGAYGVYGKSVNGYGVYCNGTTCGGNRAWTNSSDIRLKQNVATIKSALDKVMQMRGVTFEFKKDPGVKHVGFIAQELLKTVPEVVGKDVDGYYTVTESSINAVLVEAIKELKAKNDSLEARISALEAKLK